MLTLTKMSGTLQGMIYAIGLIAGLALLRKCAFGEISYLPENEERPKMKPLWIVLLVIISLAVSIGLNYLFSVLGITGSSAGFNDVHEAQFSVNIVAGIIIYGILSPLTEEIIFRGIIYNRLKRIFPLAVSFIVNCILFGIFHGNVVQGLYAVLMSALILLAYEKCKSFWAPIIVHVVANLGVYVLQYTIWK